MRKIAIVRRNGFGDLLATVPLILYFRKHFPGDKLTLFCDPRNAPLVPYLPPLDEVAVFPKKGNKYWHLIKMALKYRKQRFDVALSAKTSPMKLMNFFLFALGAKKRIAYVDHHWHAKLVNAPVAYDAERAKNLHQALKVLHLVNPKLEEVPPELYPHISLAPSPDPCSLPHPRILLGASTTRPESRFDPARYAAIVNRLYIERKFSVIILGQEQDKERAEAIAAHLEMPHLIHFPRNFEAFMVWLNLCDLYFVSDGGMAHIGAALGKPIVALFGGTRPTEWAPLGNAVETLYHPEHINCLSDEEIYLKLERSYCGRDL